MLHLGKRAAVLTACGIIHRRDTGGLQRIDRYRRGCGDGGG